RAKTLGGLIRRWTRDVTVSAMARTCFAVLSCVTRSHPPSDSVAPALPKSSLRRLREALSVIVAASRLDRVAPGNHRARLGPDAGDQNHEHVNQHKGDERKRCNEVHGARRLATAENLDQGKAGIESR